MVVDDSDDGVTTEKLEACVAVPRLRLFIEIRIGVGRWSLERGLRACGSGEHACFSF